MTEHGVREFDAVIIGAGHNSLVLANYLARCGLSVLVLERKLEAGGGLISEELTVPGYWNNTANYAFDDLSIQPTHHDLGLADFNVRYLQPEVQATMVLRDGRAISLYADINATVQALSRASQRDAAAYRDMVERCSPVLRQRLVPRLRRAPDGALVRDDDGPLAELAQLTPRQVVEAAFEQETLRALVLLLLAMSRGVGPDYERMGWTVPLLIDQISQTRIVAGGTHVLAQALLRALVRAGGKYLVLKQVGRVLVEQGAARGVELADGTRYRARQVVASGVDVWQTVQELMPPSAVNQDLQREVQDFRADELSFFQVHLSLSEPPGYRGDSAVPAGQSLRVIIGPESVAEVERLWSDLRAGRLPDQPAMACSTPTALDPRQAPSGRHTAFLSQLAPLALTEPGVGGWEAAREPYQERCLSWWRERAPNLSDATIEWRAALTPWEQSRRLTSLARGGPFMGRNVFDQLGSRRPAPRLAGYRTPIERLYLCAASSHPGLGIPGGAGYVAANVIADDLKLQKWWLNGASNQAAGA